MSPPDPVGGVDVHGQATRLICIKHPVMCLLRTVATISTLEKPACGDSAVGSNPDVFFKGESK